MHFTNQSCKNPVKWKRRTGEVGYWLIYSFLRKVWASRGERSSAAEKQQHISEKTPLRIISPTLKTFGGEKRRRVLNVLRLYSSRLISIFYQPVKQEEEENQKLATHWFRSAAAATTTTSTKARTRISVSRRAASYQRTNASGVMAWAAAVVAATAAAISDSDRTASGLMRHTRRDR